MGAKCSPVSLYPLIAAYNTVSVFTGSCMTGLQMYCESGLYCAVFRRSSAALVHLEILGNWPALHPWAKHELETVTPVLMVLSWLPARLQTTLARTGLTIFLHFGKVASLLWLLLFQMHTLSMNGNPDLSSGAEWARLSLLFGGSVLAGGAS